MDRHFTIDEAARALNVTPQFVLGLAHSGELPVCVFGGERYVKSSDVRAWKARSDARRDAALGELARLTQELGED